MHSKQAVFVFMSSFFFYSALVETLVLRQLFKTSRYYLAVHTVFCSLAAICEVAFVILYLGFLSHPLEFLFQ